MNERWKEIAYRLGERVRVTEGWNSDAVKEIVQMAYDAIAESQLRKLIEALEGK